MLPNKFPFIEIDGGDGSIRRLNQSNPSTSMRVKPPASRFLRGLEESASGIFAGTVENLHSFSRSVRC